ncbi:tripartite tricarboxylate transporter substrate binding protein [Bordetella petrii]|nr:tripartite tricarboxylate transporter substrate binding protein [Bordetella petrii]
MKHGSYSCARRVALKAALAFAGSISLFHGAQVQAQDAWPSRPIKIVVPFSAGSGTDLLARLSAEHLGKALGQPVVVYNKPGADGILGTKEVLRAEPDGYTLGFIPSSPIVMNPAIYAKLPFDPIKDLVPVFNMANVGLVLGVQPDLPVKNVAELVAYAKAHPGKLNFAAGSTFTQLAGELFKFSTGTDIMAIPYNGTAPQVTAMLGKEVEVIFDPFLGTQYMKNGRIRPLAVTSAQRSSVLPDLPTLQEAGLKDYTVETWIGMFAPVGTPKPIVDRLDAEMRKILALPEVRAKLADLSYEPVQETQEQFRQHIAADTARWKQTVADAKFPIKE